MSDILAAAASLLNALDGVAYVTDFQGGILAYGLPRWTDFARENGAPELKPKGGLNALASCSDSETATAYRTIYRAFEQGKIDSYSFGFRCDSSDCARELRMLLTSLSDSGRRLGVLHQSIPVLEWERPPVRILDGNRRVDPAWPLIRMCSYCLKIFDAKYDEWFEPEEYYQRGGTSEVNIRHGICENCRSTIVVPIQNLLN